MNQRKVGVILTYLAQIVQILTGLIYTPVMLRLVGQSEYGLYQLVYSVVSYLSLVSLGFGASYMRFYSKEKGNGGDHAVAQLNGMFLLIFLTISFICILCGSLLIYNIDWLFGDSLTLQEIKIARTLMILMVINLSLTFPNSVFNCIITSQEKFVFQKGLILIQNILSPFVTLPLLILGYGSIGMVCVTTCITFCVLCANLYYSLCVINAKFEFSCFKVSLFKGMWYFTFFIFLNQIIDQINWSVDKYLLGRLSGTSTVAIYGVGGQINNLYLSFSTAVSNVFVPEVNRIVAEENDNEKLSNLFIKVGRIQYIIMLLALSGFVFFGQRFIFFWAGIEYTESYYVAILLITPVTVALIQNIGIEIQRAKNMHKARSIVYFIISIANILISIPLIKLYNASGAAFGTFLSLLLGNGIFMNWYYKNKIGIDIPRFWRNILELSRGLIIPLVVGCILHCKCIDGTLTSLILCILIYIAVYCISIYLFGMNKYEKSLINKLIYRGK